MRRFLGVKPGRIPASRSLTALDEPAALNDALAGVAHIMNDDIEKAEAELARGTSPFHKLGLATTAVLRAAIGFEKDVLEQASARLTEAEESATEHQQRASRNPSTAHQSRIYPPGSEYALCQAESQLMIAVVGVLNESVTESLRGFYKLRKAFSTLRELSDAEAKFLRKQTGGSGAENSRISSKTDLSGTTSGVQTPEENVAEANDELEFVDAVEILDDQSTSVGYDGHLEPKPERIGMKNDSSRHVGDDSHEQGAPRSLSAGLHTQSCAEGADDLVDMRKFTDEPIDLFIHAGTALCYGLLQVLLSMVPPAFNKLLAFLSFRGERKDGLRMLWSATRYKSDINGALAGLFTLVFHADFIASMDILTKESLPKDRLKQLLHELRGEYPRSMLWLLEEARMLSASRELEKAVDLTQTVESSPFKQVEALRCFQQSLRLLFLHRYEECAEGFIKCCDLNNWSHALYYYVAGCCYVEMYRQHDADTNPEQSKRYQKRAEELLRTVPSKTSKKRFMSRPPPFELFVCRKVDKWQARANQRKCDLIDAVGVAPLEEIIYFWNGYKTMRPEHIQTSLDRLAWSEKQASWSGEPVDEMSILHLMRAACHRFLDQYDQAKTELETGVLVHDLVSLKACEYADSWTLPVAHYEMAVCIWQISGGEDGSKDGLRKCSEWLASVEGWESFDLDVRIGAKATTARETLGRLGIQTP